MIEKNIIIPIIEFEKIAYLLTIENLFLDVHTLIDRISKKWSYVCHEIQSLRERYVFLQIFEQDTSKLLFLFNAQNELIYQNKEIPIALRPHINHITKSDGPIKLPELFIKDNDLFLSIEKNLEHFKTTKKCYKINNNSPLYEMVVKRDDSLNIEYFVIHIFNEKRVTYTLN